MARSKHVTLTAATVVTVTLDAEGTPKIAVRGW